MSSALFYLARFTINKIINCPQQWWTMTGDLLQVYYRLVYILRDQFCNQCSLSSTQVSVHSPNDTLKPMTETICYRDSLQLLSLQDALEKVTATLTRMFSITNKIDNKHIRPIASSRKPLRVLSSFGGAETFSQTWTSFLPVIFIPDRPMKTSGTPFFSTVCGFGQYVSMCRHATYSNRLDPVLDSDIYLVDHISSTSIEDVYLAVIAPSDYGAVPVMKGNRAEPSCRERHVKSFQSISCRKFEDSDALWDVIYDQGIFLDVDGSMASGYKVSNLTQKALANTHITVPVSFDFKTFPLSLSTCLDSL